MIKFVLLALLLIALPLSAQNADPAIIVVGNPTLDRFSRENLTYARNVWDLAVFDGLLFIGSGNSSNRPPAGNAGPVDVWTYDATTDTFSIEFEVLPEEQIDRFIVRDDELIITGHDPAGDFRDGAIYVRQMGSAAWATRRVFERVTHVYDLVEYDGRLFAAVGVANFEGGAAVQMSADGGETWQHLVVRPDPDRVETVGRVYEFFTIGADLYASVSPRTLGSTNLSRTTSLYRYANAEFIPVSDLDLLGTGEMPLGRVARALIFGEQTVYVAAEFDNDHQWSPRRLMSASPDLTFTTHDVPGVPYDLLLHEDALLALTWDARARRVHVVATCDLIDWRAVTAFDAPTFARSFAVYNGDLYFGMGGNPVFAPLLFNTMVDQPPAETGEIWRIDGAAEGLHLGC